MCRGRWEAWHDAAPSGLRLRQTPAPRPCAVPIPPQAAFRDVQYVAFSDALTGAPVARLADSTARGGAVVLSVAAPIGRTRLLDNIMLVGDHTHLGAIEGAQVRRPPPLRTGWPATTKFSPRRALGRALPPPTQTAR